MARIGFVGLGNMGGPMAANLMKAGHAVVGFDLSAEAMARLTDPGGETAASAAAVAGDAEIVITMLPAGRHVADVYLGETGLLAAAQAGTLFLDCSTIDVDTARRVAEAARAAGMRMLDAPVSGGVAGAEAGTLTFMVGGSEEDLAAARPVLEAMGRNIVHAGGPGNGQAAKICNNLILGVSMIGVCEAFLLAEKLGLDHGKLFDVASTASGQCWSLTTYCPVPGPVPASPANRDYRPGFSAEMMLKDLHLARDAAAGSGAASALGTEAAHVYERFVEAGGGGTDFSGVVRFLRGEG